MERSGSIGLTHKKKVNFKGILHSPLKVVWKKEDHKIFTQFACWEIMFIAID